MLNVHFLPQDLHCFRNIPPSQWSYVTTPSDPKLYEKLTLVLFNKNITTIHDTDDASSSDFNETTSTSSTIKNISNNTTTETSTTNTIKIKRLHKSHNRTLVISDKDHEILNYITKNEREILQNYL